MIKLGSHVFDIDMHRCCSLVARRIVGENALQFSVMFIAAKLYSIFSRSGAT